MSGRCSPKLKDRHRARTDAEALLTQLTSREREVLDMICEGFSTVEIARTLFITPSTAQTHVKNIMSELGVHSKLEAVTFVMRDQNIKFDRGPVTTPRSHSSFSTFGNPVQWGGRLRALRAQ
jgi:DNA-binding NarL/FixJ family response regulator